MTELSERFLVTEEQDIDEAAAAELLEAIDRSLEAIARYGQKIDARLAEIDAIRKVGKNDRKTCPNGGKR